MIFKGLSLQQNKQIFLEGESATLNTWSHQVMRQIK